MRRITLITLLLLSWAVLPAQSLDTSVLRQITIRAKETRSDALIIIRDGKTVIRELYGKQEKPIYIASAGKALVALGIVKLLDLKLIDSLRQPVSSLFPEWKQGQKKDITIEMLLNHTSGIQNYMNASIEMEPPPNWKVKNVIKLALAAELSAKPGTVSVYNNKAVALLGGIIEKASGKRMDRFFEEYFFKPMNITGADWIRDEEGNPTAHGAFILKPTDFAKFGLLMLNKGNYNGKQVLSNKAVELCTLQSFDKDPVFGLLWMRIPVSQKRYIDAEIIREWKEEGLPDSISTRMKPMFGKIYTDKESFFADFSKYGGNNWQETFGPVTRYAKREYSKELKGYYAEGFRGNFLVVVPSLKLVAIRCAANRPDYDYQKDGLDEFPVLVTQLAGKW